MKSSLKDKVEKWDKSKYGEPTEENIAKKLKDQGYSYITYVFPPGTDFSPHTHPYTKKDSIASGRFLFGMDGEEVILQPGEMIEVPANKVHYARVVGDEDVIFFDSTKK
jgi:Uncharacterized conserved protein, contains double-stranded beta-helix domain